MTARNRKNEFRPKFSVGMNAHARQLVERVRQEKEGQTLYKATINAEFHAKALIRHIYSQSPNQEVRICGIMQAMQALAMAVPQNYIQKLSNGSWILTNEGPEWVAGPKVDMVPKFDSKLPGSFFAKSRSKKDASK